MKVTSEEQNKEKRMIITEDSLRDLWDKIKYSNYRGPRRRREKEKVWENFWRVENFPNMEKEIVNQVQEAQSPIQDKSKEKHAKTHTNQTNKD